MDDMLRHRLRRPLAALVQRPLMVVQPGLAPSRFRMAQEENYLHCPYLKNPFKTAD
jgi:hypothetical protein